MDDRRRGQGGDTVHDSGKETGRTRRRRLWWGAAGIALAGGLAAGWILLPGAGLRWGVVTALRDLGMVDVTVSAADLSLFGGHLVVSKMVARPALGTALGVRDIALSFRWGPLWHRRLAVERAALEGVQIELTRAKGQDVFVLNGLPLALGGDSAPKEADSSPGWGVDVDDLVLTDSTLLVADGDLRAEIVIDKLEVQTLHSEDPDRPVSFLLNGRLNGAAITLQGTVLPFVETPSFTLTLTAGRLDLAPLLTLLASSGVTKLAGHADLSLNAEGRLVDGKPSISGSGKASIAQARLDGPAAISADKLGIEIGRVGWDGTRVAAAGRIDAAGLAVSDPAIGAVTLPALRLAIADLDWAAGKLSTRATLEATRPAVSRPDLSATAAALRLAAQPLVWDGTLTWQGSLGVDDVRLSRAGLDLHPRAVIWAGRASFDPPAATGRAEGRIDLGATDLTMADLTATLGRASVEGWAALSPAAAWGITAQARLTADRLGVAEPRGGRTWLALDRVEASDLALGAGGEIGAQRISADQLAALGRSGSNGYPWRVEAGSVRLERPARSAEGALSAGEARILGLTTRVTRLHDGLLGMGGGSSSGGGASEPLPRLSLGRLEIGGGSRLLFEDRVPVEPVRLDAQRLAVTLGPLDSARPDRDSPFTFAATVGAATFGASGTARPFAQPFAGQVDARITSLELPPLSPYLAEAMGVDLRTGHFDGTVTGQARQGRLDGTLELTLSNLAVATPRPDAPIGRGVGMPVATVLDLLRDGEGRIRLTLPVGGLLNQPDIDISDAVAQAVAGALKSTMMATLRLAFPLTALIELATDDSGRTTLAPLPFAAGEATLAAAQQETLAQVTRLLRERPGLHLTVCGTAVAADGTVLAERRRAAERPLLTRLERMIGTIPEDPGPADRDTLLHLAEQRAAAVRDLLAGQGIGADRLFSCRPEIDPSGTAGRVDLLL